MLLKGLAGFLISLGIVLIAMPKFIDYMKVLSFNQTVSEYSLAEYKEKAKTPIMGGILFIIVPVLVTIVLNIKSVFDIDTVIVFIAFIGYGLIGFIDDYLIAVKKNNDGLTPKQKFGLQVILAAVVYFLYQGHADLSLSIPFTSSVISLGMFYSIFILLMFAGSSNAVNLTDGMDGLAAGCSVFSVLAFLVIAYVQQKVSLVIFCSSLIGALFGYLRYNIKPAKIFMGDTGALSLGGVLASLAMVTKTELSLILIGGVFVIETICVIIQQVSVRTIHKRVFIYTPIHYAFVMKGKTENQTVHMFWIAACVFAVIGLWVALH